MKSLWNRSRTLSRGCFAHRVLHIPQRSFALSASTLQFCIAIFFPFAIYAQNTPPEDYHLQLSGVVKAHDPSSLLKQGDRFYYFCTGRGILTRSSTDLKTWEAGPPVFSTPPAWWKESVPGWKADVWAPDVAYFNGQYYLYYSISVFGKQTSAIGLATSPTLDPNDPNYRWTDKGMVLQTRDGDPYNAIDPCIFKDDDGSLWLTFGSYWNGIYIVPLDPKTGKRSQPDTAPKHLAKNSSIEASTLYRRGEYYYLFVNWGSCCQGVKSTYNIRVGRGKSPTGPFYDHEGLDLAEGGGTLFLDKEGKYFGPGHISIFAKDGQDFFSFHYYDSENNGRRTYGIRRLYWTDSGWPTATVPAKM
jgi:arabinan endo-1,5-alpha-L-arabinosidase